jgi:hypothetical protein
MGAQDRAPADTCVFRCAPRRRLFTQLPRRRVFSETELPVYRVLGSSVVGVPRKVGPMGGCATISHGAHSGPSRELRQEDLVTAENTPDPSAPDTIVLIHGLWMTSRSWEKWVEHYEGRREGYQGDR